MTGRIVSSRADAPPGTFAVWMDWEEFGYENLDELPPVVNVPSIHLSPATVEDPPPVKEPENGSNDERPKLRLL